ncbi:MAG: TIGR04086 family membrane protein [Bacteroidota bacterium]
MIQNENSFPLRSMIYGSFIVIGIVTVLALFITVLTQFGWTGTIYWSEKLFLVLTYFGVTTGSIMAGFRSREQGWLTGLGTGILSSVWLLILAFIIGDTIHWGFYLTKSLISGFIGTFGGIIGVNLAANRV